MSAPFADRLHGAVEATGTPIVVGLDPHLALLPDEYAVARDAGAPRAERAAAMERFLLEIVDLCAGAVPAVKPQAAFFEVLGADGVAAFEKAFDESQSRQGLTIVQKIVVVLAAFLLGFVADRIPDLVYDFLDADPDADGAGPRVEADFYD